MRSRRAARAYRASRAARARRPPRPGLLTRDNRAPDRATRRARAQLCARSPVTSNLQAPAISCEHPAGDRKAPIVRRHRAARPPRPFPCHITPCHITRRGLRAQPAQPPGQPGRPLRAKPGLPRPRRPAPPSQPCREPRRPQPRQPRRGHPRRPRLRRRRRRHNSPRDRTRRSPAARRMSRGILGMPAAAAPSGMQPRSRSPRVPSLR